MYFSVAATLCRYFSLKPGETHLPHNSATNPDILIWYISTHVVRFFGLLSTVTVKNLLLQLSLT